MFCSTIIPTVNRSTLSRAVSSVLNQEFDRDEFEVIVVNDSGQPLPKMDWQQSDRVQVIHTNQRNRSVARNAGAAIAKGRYLHFLDDDDWIQPGTFEYFWELAQANQLAAWLYGGFEFVDNTGDLRVEHYHQNLDGNCFIQLVAGEFLPLQASLIKADAFFAVGGFAPLESLKGGSEDKHLTRQIGLHYNIASTPKLVATIRRGLESSTTNYTNILEQNRESREQTLDKLGAFNRMLASAKACTIVSDFWYGKVLWYCLASVKWNLSRKRLFTAISRGVFSIGVFILASRYIFSSEFWRGATKSYHPTHTHELTRLEWTLDE